MDQGYNLYNLEASFKQYLLAGNQEPVTVKNYLSDLRHFLGWLTFYLKSNVGVDHRVDPHKGGHIGPPLQDCLTAETIESYKTYLTDNNIPDKTVNRRLSTVRKFCSFCISQGWMKENPAKAISNIKNQRSKPDDYIEQFRQTVDHSVFTDVKEFLVFLSQ